MLLNGVSENGKFINESSVKDKYCELSLWFVQRISVLTTDLCCFSVL